MIPSRQAERIRHATARRVESETIPGAAIDLFEGFDPEAGYGDQALLGPEEIAHLFWKAASVYVEHCTASGSVPQRGRGRPRRDEQRGVRSLDLLLNEEEEPLGIGLQRYVTINRYAPGLLALLTETGFGPCCSILIEIERLGTSRAITEKEIARLVPRPFRKRRCRLSFDVAVLT